MTTFRFIHAADLHVDSPFKGVTGLPDAVRTRLTEASFRALDRLTELALREGAQFVVIAGDLYDSADRSVRAQLNVRSRLAQLAGQGVYVCIAHGNHDPLNDSGIRFDEYENIHVFGTDEAESVAIPDRAGDTERPLAWVHGISFGHPAVTDNLALRFHRVAVREESAPFQVAVLHANVGGHSDHDRYAPCRLDELVAQPFDYWALGHVHTRSVLHEYPHVVYPGNTQGRHIREIGERGCYVVTVTDGAVTELRFAALDDVRWSERTVDATDLDREWSLVSRLETSLEQWRAQAEGRASIVRLRVKAGPQLAENIRKHGELEEFVAALRESEGGLAADGGAFVWISEAKLEADVNWNEEQLSAEESFAGELVRTAQALLGDDERLLRLCDEALGPLRMLPNTGRILQPWELEHCRERTREAKTLALSLLLGGGGGEEQP